MTLLLGMFLFMSIRVSAYTYNPNKLGRDFTPYKNDIVFVSVLDDEEWELDYWNGGCG